MRDSNPAIRALPGHRLWQCLIRAVWIWRPIVCLLLLGSVPVHAQSGSKEQQLKAAFVQKFTMFVDWPASAFSAPDSPLVIGVLGSGVYVNEVEQAVQDRKVKGRPLVVRRLRNAAEVRSVHLLFVSAEEDGNAAGIINSLRGAPVLSVGESAAFSRAGGVITFAIEGGKVKFDVNSTAAGRASLRISSQLLKLARTVQR